MGARSSTDKRTISPTGRRSDSRELVKVGDMVRLFPIGDSIRLAEQLEHLGGLCETDDVVNDRLRIMTVHTRKLEPLIVNQDDRAVLGRQKRLESSLVEGRPVHFDLLC